MGISNPPYHNKCHYTCEINAPPKIIQYIEKLELELVAVFNDSFINGEELTINVSVSVIIPPTPFSAVITYIYVPFVKPLTSKLIKLPEVHVPFLIRVPFRVIKYVVFPTNESVMFHFKKSVNPST